MKYIINNVNTDQKTFGDLRKLAELQKLDSQHSIPTSMLSTFRLSVPRNLTENESNDFV